MSDVIVVAEIDSNLCFAMITVISVLLGCVRFLQKYDEVCDQL